MTYPPAPVSFVDLFRHESHVYHLVHGVLVALHAGLEVGEVLVAALGELGVRAAVVVVLHAQLDVALSLHRERLLET